MKKILLLTIFSAICTCYGYGSEPKPDVTDMSIVRLAVITVDPLRLDEYNRLLTEEIEASLRLEPGVIALYAVAEKENPNKVTILEIYADSKAYERHIETPHFLKYKNGTIDMVLGLELIDVTPLLPSLRITQ